MDLLVNYNDYRTPSLYYVERGNISYRTLYEILDKFDEQKDSERNKGKISGLRSSTYNIVAAC